MPTPTITIHAPAKVNLFLAVIGLRPDGYHEVDTVYQAVEFPGADGLVGDEITLAPRSSGIGMTVDTPHLPADRRNLCRQAAELLRDRHRVEAGVQISLRKRIPAGAGLGGGSSDAAATLAGLNALWKLDLPPATLRQHAAELGSDVAFFLDGGTARAGGRGERLTPLPTPDLWFAIAWPGKHVATPDVYRAWDERQTRGEKPIAKLLAAIFSRDTERIASCLRNDLEGSACDLCPEMIEPMEYLLHRGMLAVLVSGSGSAVFGIARDETHAREVAAAAASDLKIWARAADAEGPGAGTAGVRCRVSGVREELRPMPSDRSDRSDAHTPDERL